MDGPYRISRGQARPYESQAVANYKNASYRWAETKIIVIVVFSFIKSLWADDMLLPFIVII